MPTPQRPATAGVIDRLLEAPHGFGFFQAVRLLERWFVQQEGASPSDVLERRLQFRNSLSLAFPASEIGHFEAFAAIEDGEHNDATGGASARSSSSIERIEMTPAFIGLLGPSGTLPAFYTEFFAHRELHQKDAAGRAFLDIFLHRAVVLTYHAWRKHRLAIQFETDRRNRFLPMVLAIAGIGQSALRDRLRASEGGVSDDALAFYSGSIQARLVSASVLLRVLAQYLGVAVRLDPFVGRWFALPAKDQVMFGSPSNAPLGGGAFVGERVWQRDQRLRLTLGPMARDTYCRFLPGGPGALALRELLTLMTSTSLEYEVRLALRAEDLHGVCLDSTASARLGWDGFLVTRPSSMDRHDAGYDIHALA